MKTVKVTFDNGDSLVTSINGTDDEIRRYYMGHQFNLGDGAGGDLMARAVSVEFLGEPLPISPVRAQAIIAECQATAGYGPWSDRLRFVMTDDELRYAVARWKTMPGYTAFVDSVLSIAREPVLIDVGNEFDDSAQYDRTRGDGPHNDEPAVYDGAW